MISTFTDEASGGRRALGASVDNVVFLCLPLMLLVPGCDAEKSAADPAKTARAQPADQPVDPPADEGEAEVPPPAKAEPAADGLDPNLDNSGFDETGKAIAKLFDASKTCAFNRNSQISGCEPYDEFRAMQRKISPMTKAFSGQRDRVVRTRLESKEATVRAWSYNLGRNLYRSDAEARDAIETALLAETDPIALLVGLAGPSVRRLPRRPGCRAPRMWSPGR